MSTSPVGFDPSRKPRPPGGVEEILRERKNYFDPKIGQDEDGFTLQDAETLGWNVDLFQAVKHFPGRGQIEVRAGSDVLDSNEGRYGILKAVYDFELREHQRAQGRARETYGKLVRAERSQLGALNAARAAREGAPSFDLGSESDPKHPELSEEEMVAFNAAHERESQARQKAIGHAREALKLSADLDAFGLLELPEEYVNELREETRTEF